MKVDKDILIDIIKKEIEWCNNKHNKEKNGISDNQSKYFIQGLEQSITLINQIE
ncbi:TPA: hypothetical protein I9094_000021 [Clostridium perfringens]|nr:hypothetical protein [Clostridium perfringens]MDU3020094.1 hypothetical protein [Clostridium perfringens]MDU3843656.1 hypothetical protein [Clostridium perfringens]HAT4337834.1 hypothetical protein [Clostridium perfringens]HAT4344562.1 hypothetical protein [Clostridium perfringens]